MPEILHLLSVPVEEVDCQGWDCGNLGVSVRYY